MNDRCRQPTARLGTTAAPPRPGRGRLTTPLAAAVVAALYPASAALAQRAASEGGRLEEIVVTATRRELNLQEVAQSITAFSAADIQKQAFQDVNDVVSALPSVNIESAMPGRNAIIMRGISTGTGDYRSDSQVAVYLDDQPLTSISQQVDVQLIDIERVESLPGPQGTLFGSSSQAGTLVYITNKPDPAGFSSQLDFEVGTTRGGEESYDVSGHLNIPITDALAVRVVGFLSHEGGYVDNVLGPTLLGDSDNSDVVEENWNDYETSGGRIAARWYINPKWETTLSLITQTSDADGAWESDPELGDYKVTKFFDEYRDDDWYQASLNVKGDLGFAQLSVTGSYFDRDSKYEWDQMTYDQYRSYFASFPIYDTDFAFGTTYNKQKQNRYAYEVRLTSLGESRLQWLAGAFYEDVYDWWDYGAKIPGLTDTTAWETAQNYACAANYAGYDIDCPLQPTDIYYSNIYDKTVKQKALFGEVTYALTDRWSVTGGMRWFEYDREEFNIDQQPLGLPAYKSYDIGGRIDSAGKSDDVVYKFATQFKFDEDRMAYFLYSEGFRLGGNNSQRVANTGLLPLEYGPDTLQNYELGFKSEWLDKTLQLNVALFYMQWDDIQLHDSLSGIDDPTDGDPDSGNHQYWMRGHFNGGTAEQKGIEISAVVSPITGLSLEASAFFADPEFTEDTVYPDGTLIESGSVMPVSPDRKYWVAADYTVPRFGALNGDWWARWSYSYQSEVWNSITAMVENDLNQLVPSWSTSTLQFGFSHDDGWDAALVIRNLFDEQNIDWLDSAYYGDLLPVPDARFHYLRTLQKPRTVSLSFTKKW